MLYKVVPNFEFVCEILKCNHTNKSYTVQHVPVVLFTIPYKLALSEFYIFAEVPAL